MAAQLHEHRTQEHLQTKLAVTAADSGSLSCYASNHASGRLLTSGTDRPGQHGYARPIALMGVTRWVIERRVLLNADDEHAETGFRDYLPPMPIPVTQIFSLTLGAP
jgi:hypothetical protein